MALRRARLLIPDFRSGLDSVTDEAASNVNYAAELYNFDVSSGALTDGYGLSGDIGLENVVSVWIYRLNGENGVKDILMYSDADGSVHYSADGQTGTLDGVAFTAPVQAVNYKLNGDEVVIMCSSADDMAVWHYGDAPYTVAGSPRVTSMTLHYERLFVTTEGERNTVYFSDDLDPTNWSLDLSGGGFIELSDELGRLNKVVSYLNYVFVFRDYGISRLTAYADQTEFSVSNLFVSSGRIYPETVTLCGDRILFLADDGMYAFDGISTSRILPKLAGCFDGGSPAAAYYGGKYYLAARLRTDGGTVGCEEGTFVNNGLIVYSPADGSACICRGYDVSAFARLTPYAVSGGRVYSVTKNNVLPKRWRVPQTDLGNPDSVKEITAAVIEKEGAVTVTVTTERGSKTLSLGDGISRAKVGLSGRRIGLVIEATGSGVRVARPQLILRM